ncbi:MAG: hypothetical protein AAF493_18355 [Pseudomonadota bacterium]
MLDYASRGLLGMLVPQSNATVEAESWMLLPPGWSMVASRLLSAAPEMEHRLVDYIEQLPSALKTFGTAPLSAVAFACTGSSYLIGRERETAIIDALTVDVPVVTAGLAVVQALSALDAKRVALVSPYDPDLTQASQAYWESWGIDVVTVVEATTDRTLSHPIYGLSAGDINRAVQRARQTEQADAVLVLGTGASSLTSLRHNHSTPVISCNVALVWASIQAARRLDDAEPIESVNHWLGPNAHWRHRFDNRSESKD